MTLPLRLAIALILAIFAVLPPAQAQVTNGSIRGHVVDQQGGAVPGVVVEATHLDAGFVWPTSTDAAGNYRLAALPVGTYRVVTSLPGFKAAESTVIVHVGSNVLLDVRLEVADVKDTITVEPQAQWVSSLEEVVDLRRMQGLPIIGGQLADIAATVKGVGPSFHSDPTKSSQRVAQISGGNGRNINTIVDGGDNNDDTVGGQLQLFPLESIQEFNLLTQRFDAEYGRGGAVMSVITKSGTNTLRGSWFSQFRDDALNGTTFTEERAGVSKQAYSRQQFGGSIGGPLVMNRAHFFAAFERTHQDTKQLVHTGGLYPLEDNRIHDIPFRENLFHAKVTVVPRSSQYLAVRYARGHNTQPSGAGPRVATTAWVTSTNAYDSANVNYNAVVGRAGLNEVVVQYSRYANDTTGSMAGPSLMFPNGVIGGANGNAPQATEQTKWQFRDDYSWSMDGIGLSHEFRTGVNWIHEPRLYVANEGGTDGLFRMLGNDPDGLVHTILLIGGTVRSNIPLDLFGIYLQDDWRVNDRFTLNLGVRWDYLKGVPIEQTSANFAAMQAAGQAGRFTGTFLDEFGKSPRGDWDNIQPRLGAIYDVGGNGRNLLRGGWGIYTETSYTNASVLTTSLEGGGIILSVVNPSGIRKPDGTPFHPSEPIESLGLPFFAPTTGEVVSPRLEQPLSYQANIGWSHELNRSTTLALDYVRVGGRDISMRVRPNVDTDPGPAIVPYLGDVGVTPNDGRFGTAVSAGTSRYDALLLSGRRQMSDNFDLNASYTLSKATSNVGSAYDELVQNLIQDINDPFSAFQDGPSTRTDARQRVSISSIVQLPLAFQVASVFSYRSGLPVTSLEGLDLNGDRNNNDQTPLAYRYTGLNADGSATFEEAGPCETVNCSRRAPFSQLNLRVSRSFALFGSARIEAMADLFNVFNAKNPSIPISTQRLTTTSSGVVALNSFMQPTAFAGDAGQGEQRIGQIGFKLTF